jgi:hypothetical protein
LFQCRSGHAGTAFRVFVLRAAEIAANSAPTGARRSCTRHVADFVSQAIRIPLTAMDFPDDALLIATWLSQHGGEGFA